MCDYEGFLGSTIGPTCKRKSSGPSVNATETAISSSPTKAALGGVHPKVVYLCASQRNSKYFFNNAHTGNKTLVSYVVLGMQRIVFNISLALDTQIMRCYYFCFYEILGFLCAFLTRHFSCKLLCITRMLELVLSSGAKQC